jgi:hypothetical protein
VATDLQVLRRLIDEPDETTYSDADLTTRLTGSTEDVVALAVWEEKMAAAASLVNVSEGGSSRSMSQAFDHAQAMVTYFTKKVNKTDTGAAVMRKITRV